MECRAEKGQRETLASEMTMEMSRSDYIKERP
jgi:hypothetical protein